MYIANTDGWYLERVIWLVAGIMALVSTALAFFVSPYWLILTALVGLNLIVFSLTGFCLMANFLACAGLKARLGKAQCGVR